MATMSDVLTPEMITEGTPGFTDARRLEMITDAWELALLIAPCIASPSFSRVGALRSIIRRAVLYDAQTSNGKVVSSQTVGPISQSFAVNKPASVLFSPNQEKSLAALCVSPYSNVLTSLQLGAPEAYIGRRR